MSRFSKVAGIAISVLLVSAVATLWSGLQPVVSPSQQFHQMQVDADGHANPAALHRTLVPTLSLRAPCARSAPAYAGARIMRPRPGFSLAVVHLSSGIPVNSFQAMQCVFLC